MRCSASVSKSFFSICRVCPWKSPQKLSCRSRTNTSNRCVLFFTRIVGVGSFTGDLLVAQQTYTLSLFTHPKLRHPRGLSHCGLFIPRLEWFITHSCGSGRTG